MMQQTYTIQQIQALLNPIFAEHRVRRAVLFGSYAKGQAQARSDIDLLVDSGLKGIAFFGLLEDVVTALGKNVDLLDTTQVIPDSDVDREIAKTGVVIYGMRNRIVHGYSGVNMQIVRDTVHDDLPVLAKELEQYL